MKSFHRFLVAEAGTTNSRYSKVFVLAHPTDGKCTFIPSSKTGSDETSITANQNLEVKYPDAPGRSPREPVSNKKIKILLKAQQTETTTLDVANRIWKELVKRGWKRQ